MEPVLGNAPNEHVAKCIIWVLGRMQELRTQGFIVPSDEKGAHFLQPKGQAEFLILKVSRFRPSNAEVATILGHGQLVPDEQIEPMTMLINTVEECH